MGECRRVVMAVCADGQALSARAAGLARQLNLPITDTGQHDDEPWGVELWLTVTAERLELRSRPHRGRHEKPVWADWTRRRTHRGLGRSGRQPLARALGRAKQRGAAANVLDATAGLGYDAWLIASFGCRVLAVERDAVVFALACDAKVRACAVQPQVASRVMFLHAEARWVLGGLKDGMGEAVDTGRQIWAGAHRPDVVYLDPMFPPGRKTAEAKTLRIMRMIVGDDSDADALLPLAMEAAQGRVVVKRARRAPPLAGVTPSATHVGKAVRYDVYAVEDARVRRTVEAGPRGEDVRK